MVGDAAGDVGSPPSSASRPRPSPLGRLIIDVFPSSSRRRPVPVGIPVAKPNLHRRAGRRVRRVDLQVREARAPTPSGCLQQCLHDRSRVPRPRRSAAVTMLNTPAHSPSTTTQPQATGRDSSYITRQCAGSAARAMRCFFRGDHARWRAAQFACDAREVDAYRRRPARRGLQQRSACSEFERHHARLIAGDVAGCIESAIERGGWENGVTRYRHGKPTRR